MKRFLSQNLLAGIKIPHAKPQRRKDFILFQGKTLKNKNITHLFIMAALLMLAVAAGDGKAQATDPQASRPNLGPAVTALPQAAPPMAPSKTISQAVSAPSQPPCSGPSCPLTAATGPQGDIRDIRGPIHMPNPLSWIWGRHRGCDPAFSVLGLLEMVSKTGRHACQKGF